jgi:tRNA(Ile)-lysidine synthase
MLVKQVKRTIDRYHLLEKDDRLIVGVSGGVDSMVLLHVLNACREGFNLSLIVAHINHGFRPEESEKEAELVQKESERLGLSFEYGQFNVKEFQRLEGYSPQDAARKIRFHFFDHLLQKHHAQKIVLGHNADDQVETVLLRLLRGTGLKGLKGMLPIREGKVIHPLLEVWREEIEAFAQEERIPFLLDSSNLKKEYLRNRLRLTLIPLIEGEFQPKFKKLLLRTSTHLREENDYLEKEATRAFQEIIKKQNDAFFFEFSDYQSLHRGIQWRVIRKILEEIYPREKAPDKGEWLEVHQICQKLQHPSSSFILELPFGARIEKRYDVVLLEKGEIRPFPPFEVELFSPSRTFIEEIGKEVVIEETNRDQISNYSGPSNIALMDYESLQFPLRMRNFRPGDRFHPLGVKGTQKLKDFFIDHKVPKFERPKIPLLTSGEIIAWVVGYRIDERVKINEKTRKVLKVELA